MKIIFNFFILLFLTSCGYQPIYLNKDLKNYEFKEIISNGDLDINKQIIQSALFKEDKLNYSLNKLFIESEYKIEETSKNKKGQIESYISQITIKINIRNNEDIEKSKVFTEEFFYNNKNTKFELIEYQNEIKNNLITKILESIILYMNIQ